MCPFRKADVPVFTPVMRAFNTAMSEVLVSVEWLFGDIVEYFTFVAPLPKQIIWSIYGPGMEMVWDALW